MPAMALLDRDGVYCSPRFHMAAKKAKIKAHIGAEVTCDFSLQTCSRGDSRPRLSGRAKLDINQQQKQSGLRPEDSRGRLSPGLGTEFRLPLRVSSRTCHRNVVRLVAQSKLRATTAS